MFTETERVRIHVYLGYAASDLDPKITEMQVAAEGGMQDSDRYEVEIRGILAELADLDDKIRKNRTKALAAELGKLKVDPVRANAEFRFEARSLVGRMARLINVEVNADSYS